MPQLLANDRSFGIVILREQTMIKAGTMQTLAWRPSHLAEIEKLSPAYAAFSSCP